MLHRMLRAASAIAKAIDPYFNYVSLLLLGNGSNGGQNNTFLDGSTNNFTVTRNGNTTQGSFSPFSAPDGRWSVYQPSGVDYSSFTTSAGSLFEFTGDYTIELWIFPTVLGSDVSLWVTGNGSTYHALNIDGTNYNIYLNSGTQATGVAHGLSLNVWNHIAMVRSGSTVTLYTNGVSKATFTSSSTHGYSSPTIARYGGGGSSNNVKYISNLRIVKNTAVYTSTFTPPISPLSTISGTSLLTCQGNRFYDASSNGLAATVTGSPAVTSFSPFAPLAEYSAGSNGGSGYFDGSGDYLSVPYNSAFDFDSGDFTIEAWCYLTTAPVAGSCIFGSLTTDGTDFQWRTSTTIALGSNANAWRFTSGETTFPLNTWFHIAVSRSSGTAYIWLNGSSIGSGSETTSFNSQSGAVLVGRSSDGYFAGGYISSLRVLKGTAQYTSSFTPPTYPLTAITNTSLLLNFTNASIIDSTAKNDLETVGDAQVSTSVKKFGTGSLKFDGTGDYCVVNGQTSDFAFGTGNFTIEFWLYLNSIADSQVIYDSRPISTQTTQATVYVLNDGSIRYYTNSTDVITGSTLSTSTWYHIAVSRSGSSTKMFVNGTQTGSTYTDSTNYTNTAGRPIIGADGFNLVNPFNGYIDDLRITKVARYTSNFTPPSAQLPAR